MKILLFGKDGQLGWELRRALAPLGELRAFGRREADLADPDILRACVRSHRPNVIVNAAAYTAVDRAERDEAVAYAVNALAPGVLAEEARACDAWLVHYSTDYVFGHGKGSGIDGAWVEDDPTGPLSAYGRTKLDGEARVRASGVRHMVLRTGWVFGRHGANFPKTILRLAKERAQLDVVADQHGVPTSADLLADVTALALYRIALERERADALSGTYHVTASGRTTWHAYARHVVELALAHGARLAAAPDRIVPVAAVDWGAPAARPENSLLDTTRFRTTFGLALPEWRDHVNCLVAELAAGGNP
ncbi:dTDP-4-dehydrorhamnose reductase [Massilia sp. MS-15]|uniref:dTDP-4-dehydrorhamnose reductase n=1 Tax=Massilia sp. MS-15 TaxID=2878200 RepID=UPI001CD1C37A|nr:dTDP-4-dehydrorhamnose reductase [Massilia sp. MS-15]MCA1248490.1 dTDP-4-dehydrorhamnose reductase [Massilia sp. MS-15]